jgi:hypothetical protein
MKIRFAIAVAMIIVAVGAAYAHDVKGTPIAITATVVDTACYMAGEAPGPKHTACATMCAKNGAPLALADEKGKVYMVLGPEHKNPNTQLMPFIEKKVKVSGTLVERGGISAIAIKTVEAAE